jgi:two-component system, LuxR family, sensor histidine kinase DctS
MIFVVSIALLMWLLYRHELELQRNDLMRDISVAEQLLVRQLESDQAFVEQITREKIEGVLSNQQFDIRVSQRSLENPHMVLLVWTEPSLATNWVAPGTRPLAEIRRMRAPFAEQERLLRLTGSTGLPTYSGAYTATDGKAYIEYAAPLIAGPKNLGTINAVFSITQFARLLMPDWFLRKYSVAITDEAGHILALAGTAAMGRSYLSESQPLTLPWKGLRLQVTARQTGSTLAGVTVATTILLLTGLIAWSLYSLRRQANMRMASEQTLKAANDRFETVLDSLNVAVYVSDDKTGEFLFVNDHFRTTFGDAPTTESAFAFASEFTPSPEQLFNTNADDFTTVSKDEIQHRATNRWFITRARRVRWVDGRPAKLQTMGDVSDRVEAERVKRTQQEKLMLTSRLLTAGEMASTLAHEINQPLAAISNYVNGCLQRLRRGSTEASELTGAMEKASAQAERAGAIINRVREFVRSRDPRREALAIDAVIRDVMKLADPDPTTPNLQFETEISENLPRVFADRIMIEQVLLNLIRNAREAMAHLPAAERVVRMRAVRTAVDTVTLSVADCGTGLAANVADNLFSPFVTTKSEGMGMGLSICRSIIEYHEGQMRYVPNTPRGTIFEFTLPTAEDD